MSFIDYLLGKRKNTADVAKERLHFIIAHERTRRSAPDFLPAMQREIMEVVAKYVSIDFEDIRVNLENEGDYEVLELNIPLPEEARRAERAARR